MQNFRTRIKIAAKINLIKSAKMRSKLIFGHISSRRWISFGISMKYFLKILPKPLLSEWKITGDHYIKAFNTTTNLVPPK